MLLTILLVMVAGYAVFHFIVGKNPIEAIKGGSKAIYHFMLGLSLLTLVSLVLKIPILLKMIGWVLFILSIDILTPPYGIDIESLFAIPLANYLKTSMELSLGWALGIAYAFVFAMALGYVILWWFVIRKRVD